MLGGGEGEGEVCVCGCDYGDCVGVGVIALVRECGGGTALIAAVKCEGRRGGGRSVCVCV